MVFVIFRGFSDFRLSSTQLLVCGCLSCLRSFRGSSDVRVSSTQLLVCRCLSCLCRFRGLRRFRES